MKKKIGAFGAGQFSLGTVVEGRPGTTIFQNPGGGGGGLGRVAYKDPARLPPRGIAFLTSEKALHCSHAVGCFGMGQGDNTNETGM